MRFLLTLFIALFIGSALGAVTIHDLTFRLSYDKHVFPGRLLRGDIDAPKMIVQAVYYYKEQPFTGAISDTSLERIDITFDKGKIISYQRNWDENNYYKYNVTSSDRYKWFASSSKLANGRQEETCRYFLDSSNTYRSEITEFPDDGGEYHIFRFKLGTRKKKDQFIRPVTDGVTELHYADGSITTQEYKNGLEDGRFRVVAANGMLLDEMHTSPDSGMYGNFYHYEFADSTITTGQYSHGYLSGVWERRTAKGDTLVARDWYHDNSGEIDSSKSWFPDGRLSHVDYRYTDPQSGKRIDYSADYYPTGVKSYSEYHDGRDTMQVAYAENGFMTHAQCKSGNLIQSKFWNPETKNLIAERYYEPVKFYRDSVWREWNDAGELTSEKHYRFGKFIPSSGARVQHYKSTSPSCTHVAFGCIVNDAQINKRPWDTTIFVPQNIADSVNAILTAFAVSSTVMEGDRATLSAADYQFTGNSNNPFRIYYLITLMNLDSCSVKTDKLVTNNVALNNFLDSVGFRVFNIPRSATSASSRKHHKLYNFQVDLTKGDTMLNIAYINERLSVLQPGSYCVFHLVYADNELRFNNEAKYMWQQREYPPTVVFIPEGTSTSYGYLPFTVVAFGAYAQFTTDDLSIDPRHYHAYILYGDGEIEPSIYGTIGQIYSEFGINYSPPNSH